MRLGTSTSLHAAALAGVPELPSSESVFSRLSLASEFPREGCRAKPGPLTSGAAPERADPIVVAYESVPFSGQRRRVHLRPRASRRDIPPSPWTISSAGLSLLCEDIIASGPSLSLASVGREQRSPRQPACTGDFCARAPTPPWEERASGALLRNTSPPRRSKSTTSGGREVDLVQNAETPPASRETAMG